MRQALPFVMFGGFMAFFWLRARREDKSLSESMRDHNSGPRNFKPMLIFTGGVLVVMVLFALAGVLGAFGH
jgi:hypothetical protein